MESDVREALKGLVFASALWGIIVGTCLGFFFLLGVFK